MEIQLSLEAQRDLDEAVDFLQSRSRRAAREFLIEFETMVRRLASREFEGRRTQIGEQEVWTWPMPPYRIYYSRSADLLFVVRLLHSAREPIEE